MGDHDFFEHEKSLGSGDAVHTSSNASAHILQADDAFTTYKLTVYWEQELAKAGGRRMLRSEHVFGAGGDSSKSAIYILPAVAQIEDAAESLDSQPVENNTNTTSEPKKGESSKLSTGEIAGIVGGSVAGVALLAYLGMQLSKSDSKYSPLGDSGVRYSAVRRSERFSTMN